MRIILLISLLCAGTIALKAERDCPPVIFEGEIFDLSYVNSLCDASTRPSNITKTEYGIRFH